LSLTAKKIKHHLFGRERGVALRDSIKNGGALTYKSNAKVLRQKSRFSVHKIAIFSSTIDIYSSLASSLLHGRVNSGKRSGFAIGEKPIDGLLQLSLCDIDNALWSIVIPILIEPVVAMYDSRI